MRWCCSHKFSSGCKSVAFGLAGLTGNLHVDLQIHAHMHKDVQNAQVFIHTDTHMQAHTYKNKQTYTNTRKQTHTSIRKYPYANTHTQTYANIRKTQKGTKHTHIYIYIHVWACMHHTRTSTRTLSAHTHGAPSLISFSGFRYVQIQWLPIWEACPCLGQVIGRIYKEWESSAVHAVSPPTMRPQAVN